MNKLSLTHSDHYDSKAPPQSFVVREIDWIPPEDLWIVDLVELYLEIEAALSEEPFAPPNGAVVQFISASTSPGGVQIALDLAWVAATTLQKKILVMNGTTEPWMRPAQRAFSSDKGAVPIPDEVVKVAGHEMYMINLRGSGLLPIDAQRALAHIEDFSSYFDMILLVAPAADSDPLGSIWASQVDGSVLVIEAERTRWSAAIRLRRILTRCRRPILGAVLHGHQDHVPHWMSRLL